MTTNTFDLHECFSSTQDNKRLEYWKSTIDYNKSYALMRRKKQVLWGDNKYPRGTFFVITENGKKPELNKHLKH